MSGATRSFEDAPRRAADPADEAGDERSTGVTRHADREADVDAQELVPRRGRTALLVSVVMVALVAGLVAALATREPATDRRTSSPLIGEVAPRLSGETLGGGAFDIDDHRGRWVVVNYFATWCVPCRDEHPELVAFDRAHRDAAGGPGDAVLVSVLYDDDTETAADFFSDNGGDWPVVIDREARIATDWGVAGVPETYLVHPNGRVVAKLVGGVTQDGLERVMAELQGEPVERSAAVADGGAP